MEIVSEDFPKTLAEEHRELARARIRQAAREVIARRGFDVTIEEISEVSGVSPRTIFRYFACRDQLIAAAVQEMVKTLVRPIEGLPDPTNDLDGWLEALSLEIHRRLANDLGQAFWDLRKTNAEDKETLTQARIGQRHRVPGATTIATQAWSAAGGTGDPPKPLIKTFALYFSAFTTQALASDFGHTPEETAALTAQTLKTLLVQAIEEQRKETRPGTSRGHVIVVSPRAFDG
jgi:AcrR family transcriptional regulator